MALTIIGRHNREADIILAAIIDLRGSSAAFVERDQRSTRPRICK